MFGSPEVKAFDRLVEAYGSCELDGDSMRVPHHSGYRVVSRYRLSIGPFRAEVIERGEIYDPDRFWHEAPEIRNRAKANAIQQVLDAGAFYPFLLNLFMQDQAN